MKVCLLICPKGNDSDNLKKIAASCAMGLEQNGTKSDILNVSVDTDKRLTLYDYLIFIAEPLSLFGKNITPALKKFLENAGAVSGKRAATVLVGGLRKNATMATLMRVVESEGIILKTSEFISKPGEAKVFASRLNIERNY